MIAWWTGSANLTENDLYRNNNNALLIVSPELAKDYAAESEMFLKKKFGGALAGQHTLSVIGGIGHCHRVLFLPGGPPATKILREIKETRTRLDFWQVLN